MAALSGRAAMCQAVAWVGVAEAVEAPALVGATAPHRPRKMALVKIGFIFLKLAAAGVAAAAAGQHS